MSTFCCPYTRLSLDACSRLELVFVSLPLPANVVDLVMPLILEIRTGLYPTAKRKIIFLLSFDAAA